MATAKKNPPQKEFVTEDKIIELYMNDVLTHNGQAANVYLFCKRNAIEETQFYQFFNSFGSIRQEIWVKFFENAETIMAQSPDYRSYSEKDRLLALYYTIFEILTLNRTYVSWSLRDNRQGLRNLADLKLFRTRFRDFVEQLLKQQDPEKFRKVRDVTEPVLSEGAWVQFLFILKYWLDDNSRGFEKTDLIIEKSVNTVVSLLDTKPLENLIDLGKFLWKN
ncbi:TetR family transcriptional regulator C-terminal domain-containing protein [Flavobacterium selenitireducens]|uniref:TetR family transcriptional regulator C-terminal domain-containing protein n=1 Tax=Flavobacterium selenitireducens TaxID=2722704 RepID=UPI00168C0D39|nr:TetR family transcriptional regulator C-terminal domain-containing protein [Flavobacterium selenitireducens]MBD3582425.1 TetR/AcrR family transcriptional regulator [Flavobacterium selenitireducens]